METNQPRRAFLKTVAGTGAAVALGMALTPALRTLAQTNNHVSAASGQQGEWKPTSCLGCTTWCSAQVYVENGRAVKVRGNPNSKVHGVASCPKKHLALQEVYDPDRIKTPMKRTNPLKGRDQDPAFVPISWNEALETIADKLLELRKNGEAHKLALFRGRYTGLDALLYDQFMKILGSPNNISHSSICAEAEKFGYYYTDGLWGYKTYDVKHTRYMIIWGCDPVSANRQVSFYISAWGDMLDRAQVAVVEPRLTSAATKADEWLPITPGQDGALAVAMANVILAGGLWNREFVGDFKDGVNRFSVGQTVSEDDFEENHTHGLIRWWNLELKDKTPEWAASKTGIPADQIRRVATGFAQAGPNAMVWYGRGPSMQTRGGYSVMAINALNGLIGSIDNIGGTMYPISVPLGSYPALDAFQDEIAREGVTRQKIDQRGYKEYPALASGRSGGGVVTDRVADAILSEDPYDIKVLIGYFNNFVFSCPQTERWERALSKVPFSVNMSTHPSEVTWFSDIVLPAAHHMFELSAYTSSHGNRHAHLGLLMPVIDRIWDVKHDETEITWLLAEKLAQKGFPNLLDYYKSYKDPETGATPANEREFNINALKVRTRTLWDPDSYRTGDRFTGWEHFKNIGVWNSSAYSGFKSRWSNMNTSTKKFEFYSETLKNALQAHADRHNTSIDDILQTCRYLARGEMAFVPHYEEPYIWGNSAEYPLLFVDYKSRLAREGRSANCTWYQEFKDVDPGDEMWNDVAKINPVDAEKLGISNGDRIRVTSPTGSLECTAKLWEGSRPGTVVKAFGQGHWAYGRVAANEFGKIPRGGNNNDIIPSDFERLSGSSAFTGSIRVKVEKI